MTNLSNFRAFKPYIELLSVFNVSVECVRNAAIAIQTEIVTLEIVKFIWAHI